MKAIIPINKEPGYEWDVYGDGTYILVLQNDLKSWLPKPTFDTQFFKVHDNVIVPKSETLKTSIKSNIEIDTEQGAEYEFLNKKGEFVTPSHSALENKNSEASFQHVTQEEKDLINVHTEDISNLQANKADKSTTLSGYAITDAYTKTEVDAKISAVFRYKGSIPTLVDLTALAGMTVGDVYNITETGDNYAWTGAEWDKLSGEIDLSAYLTNVEASNTYETKANVNLLANIVSGHTEDISNLETNKADKSTTLSGYGITDAYTKDEIDTSFENHKTYSNVTHEELLALISNNALVPNSSYRITDYTTTTAQDYTTSAGHDFDIIVTALSTNELSEDAKCVRKAGDTYFTNSKLESWEIKYCINNDTSRFSWADTANGKGVIYYMKDEWGNECPYDFKNIQFKKSDVFLYTFGGATDDSLTGGCHHNIMLAYMSSSVLTLNFNTFGINCKYNTFGNACYSNKFGNNCQNNKFGIYCQINTFGNSCVSNTFGDNCNNNTFGNNCYYNTFGDSCKSNNFYTGTYGATKKDYLRYIVLEDGCSYNNFYSDITTSSLSYLQRIRIKGLENTSATNTQITLSEVNTKYEWLVCYTSSGVLKQYCIEDRLTNNYTYKIENTTVSTWIASTAYTKYQYEAVIPIQNIKESDTVEVIYSIPDADSNNYAPDGELYDGYIKIFAKVNTEITIPALIITKIDL